MQGNKEQNEAIVWNRGPAMILAGPGSGKTFTTVERVRYLIEVHGVDPAGILVITFTRAAARQMRDRFLTRMGETFHPVVFGTFHAVFFQILKTSCHYDSNSILTEKEKREFLRIVLHQQRAEDSFDPAWEEGLLSEIGRVKNAGQGLSGFQSDCVEAKEFRRIFEGFCRQIQSAGRLDLDDFAPAVKRLFQTTPGVLKEWRRRFPYILVDEFQDINAEQYEAVKLLAGEAANLFVVGDDDQSIYGFRGSDPSIMRQFTKDYPEAVCIRLSVNYRSRPGIVRAAGQLISENRNRFPKKIRAGKETGRETDEGKDGPAFSALTPDGSVRVGAFADEREEARRVAEMIGRLQGKEPGWSAAAIFRTASGALALAEALEAEKIPFFMRQRPNNPYLHPVCQDLLAYLRFAKRERSRGNFLRIMNRPCRYLSRQLLSEGQVSFPALLSACRTNPFLYGNIRKLQDDIGRIAGMDPFAAVRYIRRGAGYDRWLHELEGKKGEEYVKMADFFQQSAREFRTLEQLEAHIGQFGRSLEEAQKRERAKEGTKTVELLTMHGAKGLEFDAVFLPGCNEGLVPHKKSASGDQLEEERRMFYVGMTRAKERLFLSWHQKSGEDISFPSRFLRECGYREPWRGPE